MGKSGGDAPADLMSLQAIADMLSANGDPITRPSLSRYVANHPHLVRGKGPRGAKLCSYEQVRHHRAANSDREDKGGKPHPDAPASSSGIEDLDGRRREKNAKAALVELELAQALGLVVERAEVEAGMAMIAGASTRKAQQAARDLADSLAAQLKLPPAQVSVVRLSLKQLVTKIREIQAAEFTRLSGELGDGEAAKDGAQRMALLIETAREHMPGRGALPSNRDSASA